MVNTSVNVTSGKHFQKSAPATYCYTCKDIILRPHCAFRSPSPTLFPASSRGELLDYHQKILLLRSHFSMSPENLRQLSIFRGFNLRLLRHFSQVVAKVSKNIF
jgi:hypothetical protein